MVFSFYLPTSLKNINKSIIFENLNFVLVTFGVARDTRADEFWLPRVDWKYPTDCNKYCIGKMRSGVKWRGRAAQRSSVFSPQIILVSFGYKVECGKKKRNETRRVEKRRRTLDRRGEERWGRGRQDLCKWQCKTMMVWWFFRWEITARRCRPGNQCACARASERGGAEQVIATSFSDSEA